MLAGTAFVIVFSTYVSSRSYGDYLKVLGELEWGGIVKVRGGWAAIAVWARGRGFWNVHILWNIYIVFVFLPYAKRNYVLTAAVFLGWFFFYFLVIIN